MKRMYLLAISVFAMFTLTNCEKYDDYNEMTLRSNASNIQAAITQLYPQARIIDLDQDRRTIEVDIIDNNIKRDVYFDLSLTWLRTETEIRRDMLPTEVTNRIAGKYEGWFIDSTKLIDSPQGSYYFVELDKGEREKNIKIDASGNIL